MPWSGTASTASFWYVLYLDFIARPLLSRRRTTLRDTSRGACCAVTFGGLAPVAALHFGRKGVREGIGGFAGLGRVMAQHPAAVLNFSVSVIALQKHLIFIPTNCCCRKLSA